MKWFLLFVAFAISSPAWAADWSKPTLPCSTPGKFETATWSESGTSDSGMLTTLCNVTIDNTGTEPWVLWRANCSTGIAINIWWTTTDAGDCSDTAADDCGSTEAPPGCYIIVPSATGADAQATSGIK